MMAHVVLTSYSIFIYLFFFLWLTRRQPDVESASPGPL